MQMYLQQLLVMEKLKLKNMIKLKNFLFLIAFSEKMINHFLKFLKKTQKRINLKVILNVMRTILFSLILFLLLQGCSTNNDFLTVKEQD